MAKNKSYCANYRWNYEDIWNLLENFRIPEKFVIKTFDDMRLVWYHVAEQANPSTNIFFILSSFLNETLFVGAIVFHDDIAGKWCEAYFDL